MQKTKKGFTLIELMVVMAIIAVLSVLIISAITAARQAAADTTRRSNGHSIQVALEASFAANKVYPAAASSSLGAIDTALSTYLSPLLTDPSGNKPAAATLGDLRYCYATSGSGYHLRVFMGSADTAPSCGATPTGENFDVNP